MLPIVFFTSSSQALATYYTWRTVGHSLIFVFLRLILPVEGITAVLLGIVVIAIATYITMEIKVRLRDQLVKHGNGAGYVMPDYSSWLPLFNPVITKKENNAQLLPKVVIPRDQVISNKWSL